MSRFSHENEWDFYPDQAFQRRCGKLATLEGGKGSSAPPPDPNIGIAASRQMALAEAQYADFKADYAPAIKQQMTEGIRIAEDQNKRATAQQDYQLGRTKTFDDRWDDVQVPLENELIGRARAYNEPAEQERMAGDAGADVNTAFAASDGMMERDLASRGVNPNSGNYVAMRNQNAVQRAGAASAAMNKTRQAAKDIGWTRLGESAALGRGLPGFGATSASLSLGAGRDAFGAGTAGVGLTGSASGSNNAGYGAGGGLYAGAASALNQQYGNQVSAANSAANNDPFNTIMGAAAGVGTKYALGKFA